MEYYHEKIETEDRLPARIFFGKTGKGKLYYPLHWHNFLEFDLVLEGFIEGTIGGKKTIVNQGEIFFANSGVLHETDGSKCEIMRTITVLISENLLKEYCPHLDDYYFKFEQGSSQQKRLAELIIRCAEIYRAKELYYELELAVELRRICLILLKECCYKKEATARIREEYRSTGRIKQAIEYMEEHYDNTVSIEDMGRVMGMTPSYFSRFFKKSTGQTFHSYLTRIRLFHAHDMLQHSDVCVTEIAFDCGFPNVKSFIDSFKKEYGHTPAKYRRIDMT